MVNFAINGCELSAPKGTTILAAAGKAGIPIPHLCYLKDINEIAACRMCVVEVEGTERLVPACNTKIMEGMACPGGGDQPIHEGVEMAASRGALLWRLDAGAETRFSHENADVQTPYQAYLKRPLSERAHHLLHTEHLA